MVRRKKTTIFLDAKENSTVGDLKKMIEGITKKSPADLQLYNKEDAGAMRSFSLKNKSDAYQDQRVKAKATDFKLKFDKI